MHFSEVALRAKELQNLARREGIADFSVGVAVVAGEKILFLRRVADDYKGGLFELPGGVVEPGEELTTTVSRELEEETSLVVADWLGMLTPFDYSSSSGIPKRQFSFVVTVKKDNTLVLSSEHDDFVWVSQEELLCSDLLDTLMKKLGQGALGLF